jgi:peptidoglycan/LPS O-acetylase OafA/YrhL
MQHRDDIDGLRAIAIVLTLMFHLFPSLLPGGFVGVDVFFVISGYLITGILAEALDRGTFSIGGFYARRIIRLLPSLLTVLLAVLVIGWLALFANELLDLGKQVVAAGQDDQDKDASMFWNHLSEPGGELVAQRGDEELADLLGLE